MKITQKQVAMRTGMTRSMISEFFSGRRPMGTKTAQRFADLLGLTVGQVIDVEPVELEAAVKDRLAAEGGTVVPDEAA